MSNRTYQAVALQQKLIKQYSHFLTASLPEPELTRMYELVRGCIEECLNMGHFSKHTTIRVKAWLEILDKEHCGPIQLANRSNYARLLHLMLECQNVGRPFSMMPEKVTPLLQKQEYQAILQDIERQLVRSHISSRKSSQLMSPSSSQISKSTHKQGYRTLSKKKNWSKSSFNTTFTKKKQSTQCSKSKIYRQKQQNDIGESRTVEEGKIDIGQLLFKHQLQEHFEDQFGKKQTEDDDNFQEIAGMKMSNFVSLQLKQFIDKHPSNRKKLASTQLPTPTSSNDIYHSTDKVMQLLSLKVSKVEERYWQSNSINQLGTPKYLNVLRNNPYASLVISQEDTEGSSSGGGCECFCTLFQKHKAQDRVQ